jgi:hypothetical protein
VDNEVVDGFVGDGALAFVFRLAGVDEGSCGEHFEDSFGVGDSEVFALRMECQLMWPFILVEVQR